MSRFSLHNQLFEIPLQGNRRFDEVNGVRSFFLHAAACGAYE